MNKIYISYLSTNYSKIVSTVTQEYSCYGANLALSILLLLFVCWQSIVKVLFKKMKYSCLWSGLPSGWMQTGRQAGGQKLAKGFERLEMFVIER